MQHSTSDEIFFARSHWYPSPVDDQRVASLHNNHVFVEIMDMRDAAVLVQVQNAI
jgi:hypothetical protein